LDTADNTDIREYIDIAGRTIYGIEFPEGIYLCNKNGLLYQVREGLQDCALTHMSDGMYSDLFRKMLYEVIDFEIEKIINKY